MTATSRRVLVVAAVAIVVYLVATGRLFSRTNALFLAVLIASVILHEVSHGAVAYAFCLTRLTGDRRLAFGTLPPGTDFDTLIERSRPKLSDE